MNDLQVSDNLNKVIVKYEQRLNELNRQYNEDNHNDLGNCYIERYGALKRLYINIIKDLKEL